MQTCIFMPQAACQFGLGKQELLWWTQEFLLEPAHIRISDLHFFAQGQCGVPGPYTHGRDSTPRCERRAIHRNAVSGDDGTSHSQAHGARGGGRVCCGIPGLGRSQFYHRGNSHSGWRPHSLVEASRKCPDVRICLQMLALWHFLRPDEASPISRIILRVVG